MTQPVHPIPQGRLNQERHIPIPHGTAQRAIANEQQWETQLSVPNEQQWRRMLAKIRQDIATGQITPLHKVLG